MNNTNTEPTALSTLWEIIKGIWTGLMMVLDALQWACDMFWAIMEGVFVVIGAALLIAIWATFWVAVFVAVTKFAFGWW